MKKSKKNKKQYSIIDKWLVSSDKSIWYKYLWKDY